jgi:hypothetical protein
MGQNQKSAATLYSSILMIPNCHILGDFNGIGTPGVTMRRRPTKKSVNTDFSILLSRQKPV